MKKHISSTLVLIVLLAAFSHADIVIQSDGIGETLEGPETVTINTYNYGSNLQMPYNGAKVIWGPNWNNEHAGVTKVFSETFKLLCNEPITITAAADNAF